MFANFSPTTDELFFSANHPDWRQDASPSRIMRHYLQLEKKRRMARKQCRLLVRWRQQYLSFWTDKS